MHSSFRIEVALTLVVLAMIDVSIAELADGPNPPRTFNLFFHLHFEHDETFRADSAMIFTTGIKCRHAQSIDNPYLRQIDTYNTLKQGATRIH